MNQNQIQPKPADAEQESGKGLDETTCCASLAEKITVALLTPWRGEECHRLQIMRKTGPGLYDEQNMGGRNKDSIFETVLEIIEEHSWHHLNPKMTRNVNSSKNAQPPKTKGKRSVVAPSVTCSPCDSAFARFHAERRQALFDYIEKRVARHVITDVKGGSDGKDA